MTPKVTVESCTNEKTLERLKNSPIKTWRSNTKRSEDWNPLKVTKIIIGKGLTMNENGNLDHQNI